MAVLIQEALITTGGGAPPKSFYASSPSTLDPLLVLEQLRVYFPAWSFQMALHVLPFWRNLHQFNISTLVQTTSS